jgi:membrane protease YdiL (CAAX protease family)
VNIPTRALILLILPFFLNDFAILFLQTGALPLETLAYFYHHIPLLGHTLTAWYPNSLKLLPHQQLLLWGQDCIVFILIPSVFFFIYFRAKKISLEVLGLKKLPSWWDLGYSAVLALQLILIGLCTKMLLLQLQPSWEIFQWFSYDFPKSSPWREIIILYACLSAGVVEELIFRGLLIPWLQSRGWNVWNALLISSLLFSGIHWCQGPVQLTQTFFFGLVMAATFVWSRKLWPIISAHILVDLIAFWPQS